METRGTGWTQGVKWVKGCMLLCGYAYTAMSYFIHLQWDKHRLGLVFHPPPLSLTLGPGWKNMDSRLTCCFV